MSRPHGAHLSHDCLWRLVEVDITRRCWTGGAGHGGESGFHDTAVMGCRCLGFYDDDNEVKDGLVWDGTGEYGEPCLGLPRVFGIHCGFGDAMVLREMKIPASGLKVPDYPLLWRWMDRLRES